MTTPLPPGTNPAGASLIISGAVKGVLLAGVAIDVLPWDGAQVGAVALALSGVFDVLLYFGIVRPRIAQATEDRAQAIADIAVEVDRGRHQALPPQGVPPVGELGIPDPRMRQPRRDDWGA